MRLLLLDIETSPSTAYVWKLYKENIPLARLIDSSEVLCFTAKWYGEKDVIFDSIFHSKPRNMLKRVHALLNEAEAVIHYNGKSFDIPVLNKEFLLYGFPPPAPYKQIDLYKEVRSNFRFVSNKLDHISERLGLGNKIETNFKLWVDCMNKDPKAWQQMERYNKHDVVLLEKLYKHLLPWIKTHANYGIYRGEGVCPTCGSTRFRQEGYHYTASQKYKRFQCGSCGHWFRASAAEKNIAGEKYVSIR